MLCNICIIYLFIYCSNRDDNKLCLLVRVFFAFRINCNFVDFEKCVNCTLFRLIFILSLEIRKKNDIITYDEYDIKTLYPIRLYI